MHRAHFVLLLILVAFTASCERRKANVIIFDGWWAADYAKGSCEHAREWWKQNADSVNELGCESVAGCSKMEPLYEACITDPVEQCRMFENHAKRRVWFF